MTREIKFRVWDADSKKYWNIENWHVEDEYIDLIEPNNSNADPNAKRIWKRESDVIIEQFTGLKDANGDDIYENDLVSLDPDDPPYQAIFDEGKFEITGNGVTYDLGEEFMDCEIIGNIHEDKDLLEEEK